ncbi:MULTISPECIES: M2 family metallopeptidase [unclassified Corallococcus]|uniref:M2 family metallopeptidase n=1 Tax=unclassified Corallococcus TaxID=2685029 RepID=UPI001A8C79C0|nr:MULTISPECIES: M2 family metallopeptidase [unclassified Corallococcus]MBN9685586.1 M2 family metallopeptidase [Corallococcus sp. NCSPR001]WAS82969.1 M2 family metallopeptidase [Corallococcus sp. NCRR]
MTRTPQSLIRAALAALSLAAPAASAQTKTTPAPAAKATPAEAKQFAEKLNADLKQLWTRQATAEWIKSTYITDDTERNAASVNEEVMAYVNNAIKDARRFDGLKLDADTARMLHLLRVSQTLPAPADPKQRAELAATAAKLEGLYGKGKYCGKDGKGKCRDLEELSDVMAESRDANALLDAWTGWHAISRPMRPLYTQLVNLSNSGAKDIGFNDLGTLWRSSYDMTPAEFEQEAQRLWGQVKPMYDELHCYVRGRLAKQYGEAAVPAGKPIPAHLLGNMWAQEWNNIYPLVEPFPGQASLDVDSALVKQGYDAQKMVKLGEKFFTSLGLKPLPQTFWERSQFTKPKDRDVVCHASAWDVTYDNDLRIKMCIKPTEEDLVTIHHELGHDYYYTYYYKLPVLFQAGANDGFHEAIGDALTLSITPAYLQQAGLLNAVEKNDKNVINLQLKDALEKVAFLPFGLLVDQWRWDVFSGKVKPADYNKSWWAMRTKYQGIAAPVARTEQDFDAGAKYHVPANVPYTRYFLARILQFQFHKALCEAAGIKGPLNECSIYGNKAAGARLQAMLEMGASKPWPDALAAMTGTRQMDATPMLEYFAPLRRWLQEQNKGQKCGW